MDQMIRCPGCGTMLKVSDPQCPTCLRAAWEITETYAQLLRSEQERLRSRRPYYIGAGLVAVCVVAAAGFFLRDRLARSAEKAAARASRFFDHLGDDTARADSAVHKTPAAPAPVPASPPAEPPPPSAPASVPEVLREPSEAEWVLTGRVFDLSTLAPVVGGDLVVRIVDRDAQAAQTAAFRAAQDGRYRVVLPRIDTEGTSFDIRTADPRFVEAALYESDIPYARLSSEERAHLIQAAQDGDGAPTPLVDDPGAKTLSRDIFLCPHR